MKSTTVNNTRVIYLTDEEAENGCEAVDSQLPAWTSKATIYPVKGHHRYGIEDAAPAGHTAVMVEGE